VTPATSPVGQHATLCAGCETQLAPGSLACPACGALVYAETLKTLAASAAELTQAEQLVDARAAWSRALELLPRSAQQHEAIRTRIADLNRTILAQPVQSPRGAAATSVPDTRPWWKSGAAAAVTGFVVLLGKLKFLLLGLTKLSTVLSMFAFFGVYWSAYGWPLAAGLVVSIYIHEMGHVAMLKRLGIAAGAPVFIPGVGALVRLKQRIDDPHVDALVGLAGPVWGLGAALAAYAAYRATGLAVWAAIAQLGAVVNLFNLIPIWQLDGSRGFHALTRSQQCVVVAAVAIAFAVTGQRMLVLVGAVGIWRIFRPSETKPNGTALATFVALIAALSWLTMVQIG
jgi:Zn-dependent protease